MSNYKKFDTSVIRNRIKENAYDTLVGANRAIGKTQGLSEEDKASLKKFAAKHFGSDAPAAAAPKKKAAKKAAKKAPVKKAAPKEAVAPKTAKKAAKKSAKKTSKRAPKAAAAPSTEAEPAPAPTPVADVAPKAARARGKGPKAQVSEQLELPLAGKPSAKASAPALAHSDVSGDKATLMGHVIDSCDRMLKSVNSADNLIPKDVATEANKAACQVMTRAVRVLDRDVVAPLLNEQDAAKEAVLAKGKKTPPAKPRNPAPAPSPAVIEEDEEGDTQSADSSDEDEGPLTEEEERQLQVARDLMPPNIPESLRVPGVNSLD